MAYAWGGDLVLELWEKYQAGELLLDFNTLMPALFVIPSIWMVFIGCRLLFTGGVFLANRTRTELRITRTNLLVKEHFGGWRKKRKFPVQTISRLSMAPGFGVKGEEAEVSDALSSYFPKDIWSLLLFGADEKAKLLVLGYPQMIIQELSRQLNAQLPGISTVDVYTAPEKESTSLDNPEKPKVLDVPEGTKVTWTRERESVSFFVPKMGLGKGSHGLFAFGCVFSLFPMIFLGVLLSGGVGDDLTILVPILFVSVFFLVGGGLMVSGLALGTREVHLSAGNGRLQINSRSIFGEKKCEWFATDVKSLKVANTGTTVGNVAITALYVEPQDGKTTAWFKMLNRKEQTWILSHVEQVLGKS